MADLHEPTPRRTRLVDVAARAGVTVSTASRALNHPEMVRPETRARVRAAADELDYLPNRAARGLITGRSTAIAIIVPDLTNSYYANICRAGQSLARARGYEVFIAESVDGAREAELVASVSRWAEGVVLCSSAHEYDPRPFGVPIVSVNREMAGSHCVVVDPASMVCQQIDHLLALGHEQIDWVAGPARDWSVGPRRAAAERFAAQHDIRILTAGGVGFDSGVALAEAHDGWSTAIVCYSDRQAFGFVGRVRQFGLRVPGDVSVVGSDDAPGSAYFTPPLTTVVVPKDELGRRAVHLLIEHLDDGEPVTTESLYGHLAPRESTAAPRSVASTRR